MKEVRYVALTAHPVVILRDDTPVSMQEMGGRQTPIFAGDDITPWIVDTIPPSGLPVPAVIPSSGESTFEVVNGVTLEIAPSGEKEILDLPEPKKGVMYIASALTASEACRPDVCHPRCLVQRVEDGRTVILGTVGLKTYRR